MAVLTPAAQPRTAPVDVIFLPLPSGFRPPARRSHGALLEVLARLPDPRTRHALELGRELCGQRPEIQCSTVDDERQYVTGDRRVDGQGSTHDVADDAASGIH